MRPLKLLVYGITCVIVMLLTFHLFWTIQSSVTITQEIRELRSHLNNQQNATHSTSSFYQETMRSYRTRRGKEVEYQINLQLLSPSELSLLEEKYHRNITLHWLRELLPETPKLWDRKCVSDTFGETVSVLIVYHNEDIMLLLRTITTLVYRTPSNNLLEVLLIDDCSDDGHADEIREYAVGMRIPVRLSRNNENLGIANSRLLGLNKALGSVVMILDSHMEVGEMWLEPLLRILSDKPRALAVPRMRMRNEADPGVFNRDPGPLWTVEIRHGYELTEYGFQVDSKAIKGGEHLPVKSPGLFGGAFAGYRSYLLEVYPSSVLGKTWGIENSRISIRSWLCGEGIFVSPCSFVSHTNGPDIMLKRYNNGSLTMVRDLKRESMAEVINFISNKEKKLKMISRLENKDEGVESILATSKIIKNDFNPEDHQCVKDFHWYAENVLSGMRDYRPMDASDSIYAGQVKSQTFHFCLEIDMLKVGARGWSSIKLKVYYCRGEPLLAEDSHVIQFSKDGSIRAAKINACFDLGHAEGNMDRVYTKFSECHSRYGTAGETGSAQEFVYDSDRKWIRHKSSERCLDVTGLSHNSVPLDEAYWTKCSEDNKGQLWGLETIDQVPWF